MTTQLWWYVARAGGLVSWALLAATVLWGLSLSSKVFGRRPRPAWLLDLHRYLGGLAVVFVGVHVAATAVAASGWQAEAFAKAAFLGGWVEGLRRLDDHGVGALLVDDDGGVLVNRSLHPFLDGVPTPAALEVQP